MAGSLLSRLRAQRDRIDTRTLLLHYGPLLLLALAAWLKLLYIGYPHGNVLDNAWYPFTLRRAVQSGVANLATLLVLASPLLLLRTPARLAAAWLLDLAVSLLVLANVVHMRFFGDVVSVASTTDVWQVRMIAGSVLALLEPADALLFLDLALALALAPRYLRALRAAPAAERLRAPGAAARTLAAGLLLLLLVPLPIAVVDRGDILRLSHVRFAGARKIGLLNYHLYEGGRHLYREFVASQSVGPADRARARAFMDRWRPVATAPSEIFGVARGMNLILLMVESLHAFPLGMRIEGREVTPNLNALARRSLVFENFYGQTWDGVTSDGDFTSLQSLHPLPTGSVATTYPDHEYRGLPRILAERGYSTMSAHAFYGALWNLQGMHRKQGFERSYFIEHFQGETIGMGPGDREFLQQSLPLLLREREPFLGYLITLSTHHPFPLPEKHKRLELGALDGTLVGKYLHTVHYADAAIGEFVRRLAAEGLLDRSVLVVWGDHKAKLGPPADLEALLTRHAGYPPRDPDFDPRYWREENRLPLLIHLPGDRAAGRYSMSAGHLDIAPTVLNLLGIADHGMVTLGQDLTRGESSLVVFRNGSFALGDTLCVTPNASAATARCGNVRTGEALDPARFHERFDEARTRLEISDLILAGDLIQELSAPSQARTAAGR